MASQNHVYLLLLFFFFIFSGSATAAIHSAGSSSRRSFEFRPTKLFVFGDSYADTGNNRKSAANSWKYPYGITFPGKPTGRFSDGRVLTDYLAKFLGIKSPIPYKWRNVGVEHLKNGMNFAHGGTGVFDTWVSDPNMTAQIDLFKQIIMNSSYYSVNDIQSSIALVSAAGNDYAFYQATNGSPQGWIPFITEVIDQVVINLKRIAEFGVQKIMVTSLEPLGCLPQNTAELSFQQCNETQNSLVNYHNLLLQKAVANLNNETHNSIFFVLDLYSSFMSVLSNNGGRRSSVGSSRRFETPLKPCCAGISSEDSCGKVDENGERKYSVCGDPEAAFFWDGVHPSQKGWSAVVSSLQPFLQRIL